jgi:uncharacterized repeat protein (TIGR01451 family)
MQKTLTALCCLFALESMALDPAHFTITRITAPYFIVDGNAPTSINKAYVGFEVKNNSNSATTYTSLKFTITSIGTTVAGQNYTLLSPANGITNVGTLAPGESRTCYYYVSYPASVSPEGIFNLQLSDLTATNKTQTINIRNRSCISANAGGTATQTITNQDMIGAIVIDDVTYVVGNVQNGDENDFQVAVSSQFDPTKITLLGTQVIASSVPGINVGTTDSLYFISGNGSNGATVTVRWTFKIVGTNFTTYLLPCAGATSGSTNYKYALNTALGPGTPITVSSASNPLTITKTSDQPTYGFNAPAVFTITITNPGAYAVTVDRITDELPAGFSFQSIHATSQATALNSITYPLNGATGTISFEGGVTSGSSLSYYIPAGGTFIIKYTATSGNVNASNLTTTVRDYIGTTEVGTAQNTVNVSGTLPVTLARFDVVRQGSEVLLQWETSFESNTRSFIVERATGNESFGMIGEVAATGNSSILRSYSYTDRSPSKGINYYRIRIMDTDGSSKLSSIRAINMGNKGMSEIMSVFPNPAGSETTIRLFTQSAERVRVSIYDMHGRIAREHILSCVGGLNDLKIDLSGLPAGGYNIKLSLGTSDLNCRFVKM